MLRGHLHAAARLHHRIVPIEVVHLQLHEVHFGMRGEQLLQRIGPVVHGEADVPDEAALLRVQREIPHAVLVELGRALAAHVVQQVEVHVVQPHALQRRGQVAFRLFGAGRGPGQALRGHRVRVARVALHQRLFQLLG